MLARKITLRSPFFKGISTIVKQGQLKKINETNFTNTSVFSSQNSILSKFLNNRSFNILDKKYGMFSKRKYSTKTDSSSSNSILLQLYELSNLANLKITSPKIVVVGNQSSGKSSVLDGLMGEDILPKGDSMVTRRPIEVSLVKDKTRWGKIDNGPMLNISDMRKAIENENKDLDFTDVPLRIELHSPDVYDLNVVDLPGYVISVKEGQDPELPTKIKGLCRKYLSDPENIILCVASASADPATSVAIGEAQKFDTNRDRTIGVLTKIDIGKTRNMKRILTGQEYKLPLGWLGTRGRTFEELQAGMNFNELIKIESSMIKKKKMNDLRVGLPLLRQSLSELLLHRIMQFFPQMVDKIDGAIEQKSKDSDLLNQSLNS